MSLVINVDDLLCLQYIPDMSNNGWPINNEGRNVLTIMFKRKFHEAY
jgi:hypothetical protein